ncbi:hypothetical protein ABT301_26905 [Streptomyces sp. NPDC000987]|uniref:hypothetical protein n=1 Tax=Streptomyces sp. NPDC000987 TaxID=3154374 RepID=UPI003331AC02
MIKQVPHPGAGTGAADFTPALEVAYDLHAPAARAPEVAAVPAAGRRAGAVRGRRRSGARG